MSFILLYIIIIIIIIFLWLASHLPTRPPGKLQKLKRPSGEFLSVKENLV